MADVVAGNVGKEVVSGMLVSGDLASLVAFVQFEKGGAAVSRRSDWRSLPFAELARETGQSCLQVSWQLEVLRQLVGQGLHYYAVAQSLQGLCP